jgi:CDP-glucose 4,6-dehydratase
MGEGKRTVDSINQARLRSFYRGRRVFLTGHTGFKGSWLVRILAGMGAEVTGYALAPSTEPALFHLADVGAGIHNSVIADIRDFDALSAVYEAARPEIVLHLAAQPIVREGYRAPRETYETNVMGTVNLLECARLHPGARSILNVTTDKVYRNNEWAWGYRESEYLDGYDPYSNSKSCSELVTHSYRRSFLASGGAAVSTARAGNVIGGGDFSADRIVPDCVRAVLAGRPIIVRNPHSTRPYQHVLEPLMAYLLIAMRQWEDPEAAGAYNVGPDDGDCVTTGELVDAFCRAWGTGASWENRDAGGPHEAGFLKLDCSLLKAKLGWRPRWHIEEALVRTVDWARAWQAGEPLERVMEEKIRDYEES